MTTSGVTAWSLTARDICTAALQENGIIPLGRTMKAAELDACLLRLNGMLKSWLPSSHQEATGTVTVPAASASGALAADMGEILSVRIQNAGGTTYRPLYPMTRARYYEMPNPAQAGIPLAYYVSEQLSAETMYIWPVPTVNTTLYVDYVRVVETVTNGNETVDIPERYHEALYSNLAVRCAGMFGVEPGAELVMRAQRLEREMLDAQRPDSYFFEPDYCA